MTDTDIAAELADLMALPADAPECADGLSHAWAYDFTRPSVTLSQRRDDCHNLIEYIGIRYSVCKHCTARRLRINDFQTQTEVDRYPAPGTITVAERAWLARPVRSG